jgi:hypothetical protein
MSDSATSAGKFRASLGAKWEVYRSAMGLIVVKATHRSFDVSGFRSCGYEHTLPSTSSSSFLDRRRI